MGYVNPIGPGARPERVDQGVDYGGSFDVMAAGNGVILSTSNGGWPGGTFIALKLSDGQYAGAVIYYAEDITPSVSVGQSVTAGQVIGHAYGGGSGIEIGWGDPNAIGAALAHGDGTQAGPGGAPSGACGVSFNNFLISLGAPGGVVYGNPNPASCPVAVAGGTAPQGGGGGSSAPNTPNFDAGPTPIPTPGSNAKASAGQDDPVSNLPIFWAQNVSPFTGGVIDWAGLSKPQSGVLNQNYGQLLHGSMKTAGSVGVNTPNFITYFMWNPASIDFQYGFDTNVLPSGVQGNIQQETTMLSNQTFQFTLIFDRVYEVGYFKAHGAAPNLNFNTTGWNNDPNPPHGSPFTMGVQWDVRSVERLMGIYDSMKSGADVKNAANFGITASGTMPLANVVDVAFGSVNAPVMRGYFNSLDVRYTRFSSDMIPTRCEIDCTFVKIFLPSPGQISSGNLNPYVATPTVY